MQFFFLLLFNVFLGAVLYLVISLKLERSATEFRERRFRKEMDEIIKEFNVTAERNISLLEGRIRVLRRLLEKTGDIKSLDVTLDEEESYDRIGEQRAEGSLPPVRENRNGLIEKDRAGRVPLHEENNGGALIKKGLILLFEKIIDILPLKKRDDIVYYSIGDDTGNPISDDAPASVSAPGIIPERGRVSIEKDMTLIMPVGTTGPEERHAALTEEEIGEIVGSSDDRYKLVSILFDRGCAVEDISRYSGIPAGEVRLVLNLNRNKDASGN